MSIDLILSALRWNVQRSKSAMIEAVDAHQEWDVIAIQDMAEPLSSDDIPPEQRAGSKEQSSPDA
jgi:hypothetical protein